MGLKAKARRAMRRLPLYNWVRANYIRRSVDEHSTDLTYIKRLGPLPPDTMVLVAVMRDEALRLPEFLRHWRELGIGRFGLIDNGSIDDTVPIAAAQPDVELFRADGSYAAARSGICWDIAVIQRYRAIGAHPWITFADIDEHLVYDGCERHDLRALAAHLEAHGQWSLPSFMLDMYADKPIRDMTYTPGEHLLDAAPLFDGDYTVDDSPKSAAGNKRKCVQYFGGPRYRLFQERHELGIKDSPRLAKVPFARWSDDTLYLGAHEIFPIAGNFFPIRGCLLHFKFLYDFHDRVLWSIEHKQHWRESAEYQAYLAALNRNPNMSLAYDGSHRYQGSQSLVETGLIPSIEWRETGSTTYAIAAE